MKVVMNTFVLALLAGGVGRADGFSSSPPPTIKCRTAAVTTQSTAKAPESRLFYGPEIDYDYERPPPRGDYFPERGEGYPPPPPPPGGEPYYEEGPYGGRDPMIYDREVGGYGSRRGRGIGGLPRGEQYYHDSYNTMEEGPRGRGVGGEFYPPTREEEGHYYENNGGRHGDRFYGTSMNSRRDFDNFYEQRSYDGGGGPSISRGGLGARSDRGGLGGGAFSNRFPDIGQNNFFSGQFNNFRQTGERGDGRKVRSRKNTSGSQRRNLQQNQSRNFKAVGLNSDQIPGRDQEYAESKDYAPTRGRAEGGFGMGDYGTMGGDLWSHVFDGTRSAMDDVMRRTAGPWVDRHFARALSVDLKSAMRGQQQTLQPLLEEALQYVQGDPACRDLLGGDIRFDQPFRQTQESAGVDEMSGILQEERINVQVAAEGTRGRGSLDIFANNLGIREMILTVEDRRINVKLGGLPDGTMAPGIDLVDRGPAARRPALDRPIPEDVLDAEFEVMNNTAYNGSNNNSRW